MKRNKLEKRVTKQLQILTYTVSRLRKYFIFYQAQTLTWVFFSLYKGIPKTWFLLAKQTRLENKMFLLTQKIKNKVSSNKK